MGHFVRITAALALIGAAACEKKPTSSEASSFVREALPADAVAVFGANLGGLKKDGFLRRELEKRMPPQLERLDEDCGIDIFSGVEHILLSKGASADVIAAEVSFGAEAVEECLRRSGAEVRQSDDLTEAVIDGESTYLKWTGDIVAVSNEKRALARLGEGPSDAIVPYLDEADTGAALWAAGAVFQGMRILPGKPPKGGYASVREGGGLQVSITAAFPETGDAQEVETFARKQMEQLEKSPRLGDFAKMVKLSRDRAELELSLDLGERELGALVKALGGP